MIVMVTGHIIIIGIFIYIYMNTCKLVCGWILNQTNTIIISRKNVYYTRYTHCIPLYPHTKFCLYSKYADILPPKLLLTSLRRVQIFVSRRLNYDFIANEIDGQVSFLSLFYSHFSQLNLRKKHTKAAAVDMHVIILRESIGIHCWRFTHKIESGCIKSCGGGGAGLLALLLTGF